MSAGDYLNELLPGLMEDLERHGQRSQYFDDVELWAKHKLGVDLWYKQVEVADDIATGVKKSVAVRAGHGVGKSFLAGVLACWWIDTRPIQFVFVASTAPSADQVSAILWREIRKFHKASHERYAEYLRLREQGLPTGDLPDAPLPGYITQQNKWKDDLGNLIGQGRKPPDHNEDSFQGIHAEYVLAIGDEACGLKLNMVDSLSNITSNEKSRRLLIGNPTNPRSHFGTIFSDQPNEHGVLMKDAWSLHHISVLDSPNFHGGDKCKCPEHKGMVAGMGMSAHALASLTNMSYVVEKKLEYGEESARYKARVLGEFAWDAGNNLFTDFEMGKARDAVAFIDFDSIETRTVLGVDVARSKHGDTTYVYKFTTGFMHDWEEVLDKDETTSFEMVGVGERVGGELRYLDSYRGTPLVDRYEADGVLTRGQATFIHQHAIDVNAMEVRVDSGGLGVGLVDGLMFLSRGKYKVIEMQGGGATPEIRSWINNRAYQFDQMKDRFGLGLIDIDPSDRVLINQLEDILAEFVDPHGAMKIESKDSMKKRGVKSPDAADAAWYACANLTHLTEGPLAGKKLGDVILDDPFELLNESRAGYPI